MFKKLIRNRSNYWSCTKLADRIRGAKKPVAATAEQWRDWHLNASTRSIRYWLAEELLDTLQNIVCLPRDLANTVRAYIGNRWVHQSHALRASVVDIPRGQWRDVGNRFLPCLFNELVDFVEVETAWNSVVWNSMAWHKYNPPRKRWWRINTWRCPQAGLEHLHWAAGLKHDEHIDPSDPMWGKPTQQALAAQEIIALYTWWTTTYRNRPDPYEESGVADIQKRRRQERKEQNNGDSFAVEMWATTKWDKETEEAYERFNQIEERNRLEEDEMLIRLIKIRGALWT